MNEMQQQLLLIRGTIFGLPGDERIAVEIAAAKLREVVVQHGDHGTMALALIAAELAAKD